MGRVLTSTMDQVLAGDVRDIDWTIELTFPDATIFKYATSPMSFSRGDFTNDLENVSEIRQTLDAAVDRVSIGIQNKDRVLGLDVAANWRKWRNCEAVIGRMYYEVKAGAKTGVSEWIEMFRGTVQQPQADDLQVTFDVIPDTIAQGENVANHNLNLPCGWLFKDPKTCAYTGPQTVCDHHLKGNCTDYNNTHHFGGMENYNNPDVVIPGSGGDPTGGDDTGIDPPSHGCPRVDQWTRVKGADGCIAAVQVRRLTTAHWLWHPIKKKFFKVRSLTLVPNQPIWELVAANGAISYSSFSHPALWFAEHITGERVDRFGVKDPVLTVIGDGLEDSTTVISSDTGEFGDVMRIEIDSDEIDEKIYCAGDSHEKLIVCHNLKPLEVI
jgi:hypothetical protein